MTFHQCSLPFIVGITCSTNIFSSLSLSHLKPRLHSTIVDQKLTRLTPQLIQIEIYISTKLFFIVQQLFFLLPFFPHENENLAETTLCNVEYFVGRTENEREVFFCIIKWKIFNDKFNLDCSTFMKFACEKLNSITRETLISIERFKWRIG